MDTMTLFHESSVFSFLLSSLLNPPFSSGCFGEAKKSLAGAHQRSQHQSELLGALSWDLWASDGQKDGDRAAPVLMPARPHPKAMPCASGPVRATGSLSVYQPHILEA